MGGAETLVRLLARSFLEKGHDCAMVVSRGFSDEFEAFRRQGNGRFQTYAFPCIRSDRGWLRMMKRWIPSLPIYRRFFSSQYDWDLESLSFNLASRNRVRLLEFDVMSVHYYMDLAFLKVDRPIAFHFHGIHPFPGATKLLRRNRIGYVACSKFVQNQVYRFHRIQTEVVYNGVDCERFSPRPAEKRWDVLFLGRLYENKGISTLLALARAMPRIRFAVAGEGPMADPVARAGRSLPNLSYLGRASYDALPRLLSESKLLICPSKSDPFPLVILEAMACGVPVIASRIGGIPEAVDEEVGRLITAGDVSGFQKEIETLLQDPNLLGVLGQNGRRRCLERFSIEETVRQTLRLYETAAGKS